jgi:hypothetical protein
MKRILIVVGCAAGLILAMGTNKLVPLDSPYLAAQEAPAPKASPTEAEAKARQAGTVPDYAAVSKIIAKHLCTVCHGGSEPRAGLSLDDHKSMMKGSKRGPVIVPGKPESSELIRRLNGQTEPRMPFTGPPWLSDDEVATIEQWISGGAKE